MDLCPAVGEVISVLLHELRCEREKAEEEGRESERERERGEKNFLQKGGSSGDTWAWQSRYLSN